ncbi:alanine--tRNA ligase [Candidatus Berkiella aquae]|uniref:Alanine--tRNA ligase n=1 Tax=Candidatus Berkiella aquae TaxID=295108 RepID=A0A0Q9YIP3_9GAMM|nr:alanine--tRNA ligase [Candidatus Berkiella aquae]MCS5712243.1 alanine--tRNA ligase [Candidatus Berkiella aquae]
MKVGELRKSFLRFFEKKGHAIVPSSSLVPHNDDTLLFTNAGMVQFKEVFLGLEKRPYQTATSAQCCVRAGGKHNDLENVGYTARHHTFFEMLGNFSFGDYFKREAIAYAWEYLTQELKIDPKKLWVTVYEQDQEAEDIWLNEIKVDKSRFSRCGEKDNFWSMGDTGPCGPCTEIYYDHGPSIAGGPPGSPDAEGDRYVEIWNLVFMQFNRDAKGNMTPLPKPSVDTGMGMERVAAVMQGVTNNYDIDLFKALIQSAMSILELQKTNEQQQKSLRVLADHIRSCTFLIADGVMPSNEGRGYVLRRIMRRALRHGNLLGAQTTFFNKMVAPLVQQMGDAYPHIQKQQAQIERVILKEEEQFARTLDQGLKILEQDIKLLKGQLISGETVFKLYDTYGFPVDLTADIARERGLQVDIAGFEMEMEKQRERARAASQFDVDYNDAIKMDAKSQFTGYHATESESKIIALLKGKETVTTLKAGDKGSIVLLETPFYAESGGQVGDTGIIQSAKGTFIVEDTQKSGDAIVHIGHLQQGNLSIDEMAKAVVNSELRQATKLNHSATHLLHAALREIVGHHVLQKGSLVAPDRLRFDFAHFEALTPEQIQAVENRVNEKILENTQATITETTPEEAVKLGAMALFGEKYGDKVRVLNMGNGYSVELCGGTHAGRTGDIGLFKIIAETGIASGVRRIEALTGHGAMQWLNQADKSIQHLASMLKGTRLQVEEKVTQLLDKLRDLEKETQRLKAKLASGGNGGDLTSEAITFGDIKLLVKRLSDTEPKIMRELMDDLKNKLGRAIIVLAAVNDGKVQLIVGVTNNCTDKVSAGELVNFVALQVGGKGGGRPDLAQAGGTTPEHLDKALASVSTWVQEKL